MKNGYRIGSWTVLWLVALRVLIGLQFLAAGLEKLDPSFSSAGFLRSANGPLAEFYQGMAPLPHRWDVLADRPLPAATKFEGDRRYLGDDGELQDKASRKDRVGHIPFPTAAHGPWASQVAKDWQDTVERVKRVATLTEEQCEAADAILADKLTRLARYFEEQRGALEEYQHEVNARLNEMLSSDARGELPYVDERIAKKKSEVMGLVRPLVADIEAEENQLKSQLHNLLTNEQKESKLVKEQWTQAIRPTTQLDSIDLAVTVVTLAVGGLLIAGLFTRLAALVGAGFLLSVMSTQPPWAEGVAQTAKLLAAYQGIEVVALLLLAAIGAGMWAGLDGLLWRRAE